MIELRDRLRAAYAGVLGAEAADVALTTCTSDGVVRVLAGLDLGPGDEVLTAPDEHPGLLGPLATLRDRRGVDVRAVPFAELADAVGPRTKLVACSHVSWVTGRRRARGARRARRARSCSTARRASARSASTSARSGCAFYAGSGQKWLCGPIGSGMLWVAPEWRERLAPVGATYLNLADASGGLDAELQPDARRYDAAGAVAPRRSPPRSPPTTSSPRTAGPRSTSARRRSPPRSPQRLAERGRTVAPRGETTLVSFEDADPEATRDRLAEDGDRRPQPARHVVRARVGGRLERRGRPRAPAGCALRPPCLTFSSRLARGRKLHDAQARGAAHRAELPAAVRAHGRAVDDRRRGVVAARERRLQLAPLRCLARELRRVRPRRGGGQHRRPSAGARVDRADLAGGRARDPHQGGRRRGLAGGVEGTRAHRVRPGLVLDRSTLALYGAAVSVAIRLPSTQNSTRWTALPEVAVAANLRRPAHGRVRGRGRERHGRTGGLARERGHREDHGPRRARAGRLDVAGPVGRADVDRCGCRCPARTPGTGSCTRSTRRRRGGTGTSRRSRSP